MTTVAGIGHLRASIELTSLTEKRAFTPAAKARMRREQSKKLFKKWHVVFSTVVNMMSRCCTSIEI